MTRTGELVLIGVSITVFIALIISQTIWTREHDKPGQLQQHNQVVLGDTAQLPPAS
ncbi:MAG: hypothetical protein ABFS24_02500 [Pseudomonadota bacterium]